MNDLPCVRGGRQTSGNIVSPWAALEVDRREGNSHLTPHHRHHNQDTDIRGSPFVYFPL